MVEYTYTHVHAALVVCACVWAEFKQFIQLFCETKHKCLLIINYCDDYGV